MYGVGALNVKGGIQLFIHPVSCSDLTVLNVIFVAGIVLRIRLESVLESTDGNPSTAKSNDDAPPSMPVDIFSFRRNLAKARSPVLAILTDKKLRGDYVLVFELIVGASLSLDLGNALDS